MSDLTNVARIAQYALTNKGRLNPTEVAENLDIDRKAAQSAFNGLCKRGLFKSVGRGSYQANRLKLAEAYDFSDTGEDLTPVATNGSRIASPRFKPAPFVVLQDPDGGLWLAEKLRG